VDDVSFEGRDRGPTTVSVRTADGHFGGAQIADQLDVEVAPLQVGIHPDDIYLDPGEDLGFDVSVSNSKYPELVELANTGSLQGTAELTVGSGGEHLITYTAPADPDETKPDLLVVRHTATTGARGYSTEERVAIATIRFGGILVTADETCVAPGGEVQFSVDGFDNSELVWSASAGDISDTGVLTAPDTPGTVVVTAALASDPEVKDSLSIQVGGCTCRVSFSVAGTASTATEGLPYFTLDPSELLVQGVQWIGDLTSVSIGFGDDFLNLSPIPVGQTGAFPAHVQGFLDGVGTFSSDFDPDSEPVAADVTAFVTVNDAGNILVGTASGSVVLWTNERPVVGFSMSFHIEAEAALSDLTRSRCLME
jgi:hypothetical protein